MRNDDWMPLKRIDYRTLAVRERYEQRLPEIEARAIDADRLHERAKALKGKGTTISFGKAA